MTGRTARSGSPGAGRTRFSVPDGEQRLEVVLREDLEGDHRVRALDPVDLRQPASDQRSQLIGLAHADDRHEVPLPRHRVGLGHALEVGELAAERRHRRPLGFYEDDRVGHRIVWVSPGWRITTSLKPAFWTSDL